MSFEDDNVKSAGMSLNTITGVEGPNGEIHQCNCMGCCARCGQCRTALWHLKTCELVFNQKMELKEVVRGGPPERRR